MDNKRIKIYKNKPLEKIQHIIKFAAMNWRERERNARFRKIPSRWDEKTKKKKIQKGKKTERNSIRCSV